MNALPVPFLKLLNGDVQYVIPIWQRRYCWGKDDIERLVEDLITIAKTESNSTHYGGTILTLQEPNVPGEVLQTYRVIDGQQRLTTVTVLLACISNALGQSTSVGEWTAELLKRRITNPDLAVDKYLKLRLQPGDRDEYKNLIEGFPSGSGALTQAWRTLSRLVEKYDIRDLLTGLSRFQVVSIGLDESDDPQQTFESINATGRPLTESEKIKNWLLIGLPADEQQLLYREYWLEIESSLDAKHDSTRIDIFFRDFLRWQTGDLSGISTLYSNFRRWAVMTQNDISRPILCRKLSELAKLYGFITGAFNPDENDIINELHDKVKQKITFLRRMNIDIHRPFTLRILHDTIKGGLNTKSQEELHETFVAICTWLTRLFLADRSFMHLNRAFSDLAKSKGPDSSDNMSEHWISEIKKHRHTDISVPTDDEVKNGCQSRVAYSGTSRYSTFAILYAIMQDEQGKEPVEIDNLTLEHIMPQKLTQDWQNYLGDDAERVHVQYRHCIGNLTLSGYNPELGARAFEEKKTLFKDSNINMTQRISSEESWGEYEIIHRAIDLANRAIELWPWHDDQAPIYSSAPLRWKLENGEYHNEHHASEMTLNVVASLLDLNSENATILLGDSKTKDIHKKSNFPDYERYYLKEIPRHPGFVMYPYAQDWAKSIEHCKSYSDRCGFQLEVRRGRPHYRQMFWTYLLNSHGGVPGQKKGWIGKNQWSRDKNKNCDWVGILVRDSDICMYVKQHNYKQEEKTKINPVYRMQQYSSQILNTMPDQKTQGDAYVEAKVERSISIVTDWDITDNDQWEEVAIWIKEQCNRMHKIIADYCEKEHAVSQQHT